jgi:hypothetical protein
MDALPFSREGFLMSRRLGYATPRMSPAGFAVSSFISLRGIPQPSALAKIFACKLRSLFVSVQGAAGVSRSEIKEECGRSTQGDIRGDSRPSHLGSGSERTQQKRSTTWAS